MKKTWESKDTVGAWCLKCKVRIPYKVKDVNGVKRHVEKYHPNLLEKEISGKKRPKTSTIQDYFASVPTRDLKPSLKADQKMGEALLVKWTSKSLRPFTIVEDEGFLKFAHWLNNLKTMFKVPSRNKHRAQLMKVADLVMKKVQMKIANEMNYYAITSDIWSSRVMESFMSVTLHYLTEDFEMINLVLEVSPFHESHTAINIATFWKTSFEKFGLRPEKLAMMMRDNASNGVKACNNLEIRHFGCVGHSIHLVIGPFVLETKQSKSVEDADAIEEGSIDAVDGETDDVADYEIDEVTLNRTSTNTVISMQQVVSKVRTIAKYIKNSPKAKDKVASYMENENNGQVLSINLDVRTRWNSAYDMISKFIKLKGAIQQFSAFLKSVSGKKDFNRKKLPDIYEEDWALLSGLCIILKPFKDVTEILSGEKYPTFSQALPLLRTLENFLSDHNLFSEDVIHRKPSHVDLEAYIGEDFFSSTLLTLKNCQNTILADFTKRFAEMDSSIFWITLLDPRCRKLKHLNDSERLYARSCLIKETLEICSMATCELHEGEGDNKIDSNINYQSEDDRCSFDQIFDTPPKARNEAKDEGESILDDHLRDESKDDGLRQKIELEVANYLNNSEHISRRQDPLSWWRENKYLYPRLALTARKWLCVCATSTPSERVFSNCGVALTAKRSRMKGSCLQNQILLKNNIDAVTITIDDILNAL